MTTVFGWWDWDAETPALVNRVTGERVVFRGKAQEADLLPATETWLRFDYQHQDLTFPVLVEHLAHKNNPARCPTILARASEEMSWRVDYAQSVALSRRLSGGAELFPRYGVWRRVDDCISDALACWPAVDDISTGLSETLFFTGGWLNGAWRDGMSRNERRLFDPKEQDILEDHSGWLFPLDATSPSAFEFHGWVPAVSRRGPPQLENPVLLNGLEFTDPECRFSPQLSEDCDLSQLGGKTAYLLSQDKHRLLYPCFGWTEQPSWATGHWRPCFSVVYVDDDVVASSTGRATRRTDKGNYWSIGPSSNMIGLRREGGDPSLFLKERPVPGKPAHWNRPPMPSRKLWRHLQWSFADGWCYWPGSKAHCDQWLPPLALVSCCGIFTGQGGFLGGRWLHGPSFSVIT